MKIKRGDIHTLKQINMKITPLIGNGLRFGILIAFRNVHYTKRQSISNSCCNFHKAPIKDC